MGRLTCLIAGILLLISPVITAAPRIVEFSGYDWVVRYAYGPVAPGPNYFSNSEEEVWVDDSGYLHLSINERDGRWYCSELTCRERLGYGIYTIVTEGRIDLFDPQTVFGFFTWDRQNPPYYSEIDIEFSRWSDSRRDIGQYTLQPYTEVENYHIFPIELDGDLTTHQIIWEKDRISFRSWHGGLAGNNLLAGWDRSGDDIPVPNRAQIHFNLWLFQGKPPQEWEDQHLVIREFSFQPSLP